MLANPYQLYPVSLQAVTECVEIQPDYVSPLILAIAPCRSGSTVLMRVFGSSGAQAHFQQLKNILRWLMQGQKTYWFIPPKPNQVIFLKETLGPYVESECTFNPLQVLLEAGFPTDKLQVMIIGRDPLLCWQSWRSVWGSKVKVDSCIQAYGTVELIRQQAHAQAIQVTCLVYEALQTLTAEQVIQPLFKRLGLLYTPYAVSAWDKLPSFGQPGSNIIIPNEPPAFYASDLVKDPHKEVLETTQLMLNNKTLSDNLVPTDLQTIQASDIYTLYQSWRQQCETDLNIHIAPVAHETLYTQAHCKMKH